jgi:uncharacterized protein involved in propanediol utilization
MQKCKKESTLQVLAAYWEQTQRKQEQKDLSKTASISVLKPQARALLQALCMAIRRA